MSATVPQEVLLLLVALGVVYLAECFGRLRPGQVAVEQRLFGGWKLHRGSSFFRSPLPGGLLFVLDGWRLGASESAAYAETPHAVRARKPAGWGWRRAPWDKQDVVVRHDEVRVGDALFFRGESPARARAVARALARLRRAGDPAKERARWIAEALDVDAAKARAEEVGKSAGPVGIASAMWAGWLLVVCALILRDFRWIQAWPLYVTGGAALYSAVVLLFWRAHRRIHPDAASDRRQQVVALALSPLGAIRAPDRLSRDALADHHALACALALLEGEARDAVARAALIEVLHPAVEPWEPSKPEIATDRAAFLRFATPFVREALTEFDADALLVPEPPPDPGKRAYCPRCFADYRADVAACEDCGGLALERWASPG